jgi:hypothetical protein
MISQEWPGFVALSICVRHSIASAAFRPHISRLGRRLLQTAGRSVRPKIPQRLSGVNFTQRIPAGLPPLMFGIGDEIDGAMQQAAQPIRHIIGPAAVSCSFCRTIFSLNKARRKIRRALNVPLRLSFTVCQVCADHRPCMLHNSRAVTLLAVRLKVATGVSPGWRNWR